MAHDPLVQGVAYGHSQELPFDTARAPEPPLAQSLRDGLQFEHIIWLPAAGTGDKRFAWATGVCVSITITPVAGMPLYFVPPDRVPTVLLLIIELVDDGAP